MNVFDGSGIRDFPPNEVAESDMGVDSRGQALVCIESLLLIVGSVLETT